MAAVFIYVGADRRNSQPLPDDTPAVAAAVYAHLDDEAGNPGGIMRIEINPADIQPLGNFDVGAEVFVESEPEDVLDDMEPEATRIWWRGTITEPAG